MTVHGGPQPGHWKMHAHARAVRARDATDGRGAGGERARRNDEERAPRGVAGLARCRCPLSRVLSITAGLFPLKIWSPSTVRRRPIALSERS
eukprot:COSAG02_NODE_1208_length_13883_cov_54.757998_12_plen_92_part_00